MKNKINNKVVRIMDMNKETLEAALKKSATNSTKSQEKTSKKTDLPSHWISALFKKFQARYLHKWTSAIEGIEELAVSEWSQVLGGLTGEQLRHGFDSWKSEWPPTAEEFKSACIGKVRNGFGLDYVPECYREKPIIDESRLLSSDQREAAREKGKEELQRMKDILKGR